MLQQTQRQSRTYLRYLSYVKLQEYQSMLGEHEVSTISYEIARQLLGAAHKVEWPTHASTVYTSTTPHNAFTSIPTPLLTSPRQLSLQNKPISGQNLIFSSPTQQQTPLVTRAHAQQHRLRYLNHRKMPYHAPAQPTLSQPRPTSDPAPQLPMVHITLSVRH